MLPPLLFAPVRTGDGDDRLVRDQLRVDIFHRRILEHGEERRRALQGMFVLLLYVDVYISRFQGCGYRHVPRRL